MIHKIFNASNMFGIIAFLAVFCIPGAVENELYITAAVLIAIFAGCVYLSIKENGKRK